MPLLSTLLHATTFSKPFLNTLIPSVGLAYTLQGLVAVPSILAHSEKFYDLSGSITYLSCVGLSLYLPALRARNIAALAGVMKPAWPSLGQAFMGGGGLLNWRQVVLSAAVGVWATRCMFPFSFLSFRRSMGCSMLGSSFANKCEPGAKKFSLFSGIIPLSTHFC